MRNSSNNVSLEITPETSQPQESQLSKFQNQYQSTLNYFFNSPLERKDIIKALPHTLEIIDTLADKLLDPNKKIEFKELSKLTTKELTEIKTNLQIINQKRERPQTPMFDAVKEKCAESIDTLITNKEKAKKNRFSFFSAVRKFSRFMGGPQTSDLNTYASLKIDQKLTDLKTILAPQSEIDRKKTDEEIANILKQNTNKLRNLNAVGAQNSGGNSSGCNQIEVKLTFGASRAIHNTAPPKSEPNATLAGPNLTKPSLTPRQIAIADELRRLKVAESMPSIRPPAPGLPTLRARKAGSSKPSSSPSSPKSSQNLVDQVIEKLGPDSPQGQRLEETKRDLIDLRRKHEELRRRQLEERGNKNEVRKPGKGGENLDR